MIVENDTRVFVDAGAIYRSVAFYKTLLSKRKPWVSPILSVLFGKMQPVSGVRIRSGFC